MILFKLYEKLEKNYCEVAPLEALLELLTYRYFGDSKSIADKNSLEKLDYCKNLLSKETLFEGVQFINWDDVAHSSTLLEVAEEILTTKELPEKISGLRGEIESLFEKLELGYSKKTGLFITPRGLAELISYLFLDKCISDVYDPACGSGSVLSYMFKQDQKCFLYGSDINSSLTKIAFFRLLLQGSENIKIVNKNSFEGVFYNDGEGRKFDAIVCVPPFSMPMDKEYINNDPLKIYKYGKPHPLRSEYSFISLMIHLLKDDGRGAIVVPTGVLSRASFDGVIRNAILDENIIDTVIWLPEGIFPSTRISCAVVVFDKSRALSDEDIFLIDATRMYKKSRVSNTITKNHLERLLSTIKQRKNSEISISVSPKKVLKDGGVISLGYLQNSQIEHDNQSNEQKSIKELMGDFIKINGELEILL